MFGWFGESRRRADRKLAHETAQKTRMNDVDWIRGLARDHLQRHNADEKSNVIANVLFTAADGLDSIVRIHAKNFNEND